MRIHNSLKIYVIQKHLFIIRIISFSFFIFLFDNLKNTNIKRTKMAIYKVKFKKKFKIKPGYKIRN